MKNIRETHNNQLNLIKGEQNMNNCENLSQINCIILEIEKLKEYIKQLEERVKELEKK